MPSDNISTPDGDAVKAELGLNSAVRQQTQARNAARQALDDVQRERQAPRLRAQARALEASRVTVEALGVHDKLPDFPVFNSIVTSRASIAASVKATFDAIAQVYNSPHFEGARGVDEVARMGREALARFDTQIAAMRGRLSDSRENVNERVQKAMQPPTHLASMVASARDAMRMMKEEDRHRLVENARGNTAELLMYAIGGAPAFLCGVPEGKQMERRSELLAVRDPDLLTLEPAMPHAFAALDKMHEGITRLIGSVADFDAAKALAALRKG